MQTVLQFIGLLLLLILSFLGANYLLNGDIIISSSLSLFFVIIIFYLVEFLKKRKVQITKSKFTLGSILLWILYLLICIPIGYLMIHALNVELNAKQDIQNYAKEIVAKNQNVVNLFQTENQQYVEQTYLEARNALDLYVHTSNTKIKDSVVKLLENSRFGITNFNEINKTNFTNSANALQSALEIRSKSMLDSIQDRSKTVINNTFYLVNNWSRLRVVNAVQELENMLEKNTNQLNNFLTIENFKFNMFSLPENTDPETLELITKENNQLELVRSKTNLASFNGLWQLYKPYWLIIPTLVFFFFLIIPYLLEKTSGIYIPIGDEESETGGIEI